MILGFHLFLFCSSQFRRTISSPPKDTFNELSYLILHGCRDVWRASVYSPPGPVEIFNGHEKWSHTVDYRTAFCDSLLSTLFKTDLTLEVCFTILEYLVFRCFTNILNSAGNQC